MIALLLIACPLLPFMLMLFSKATVCLALARCGMGAVTNTSSRWSSPPTVCHAGERSLCAVLKLRHWLNPVPGPGWQNALRRRCSAVWR
jgi:formate hydrogenlyase subunit 3